jgi:glycosyltransferase involved in cell wall biosynthesis
MMRILHVNVKSFGGGVEQYLDQLFVELNKAGHKNALLFGEKEDCINRSAKVEYYNIDNITHLNCKKSNSKLEGVQQIINSLKPNIVYIHQVLNPNLIDFLTKKLPSIRFMHGFKMVCPDGLKTHKSINQICDYPLDYGCQKRAYFYNCMPRNPIKGIKLIYNSKKICNIHKKRSFMIVASNYMKNVLIRNGFKKRRIKVIPYFTYLPADNTDSYSNKTKKILALGRVVKAKGFYELIDAFSFLDDNVSLDIVGDGDEVINLKRYAQQRGLNSRIYFHGWLKHENLKDLYFESAVVVVPSIWPEPFGIVGIEAMAHNRPVVAFDSGGISDWLIDGNTGFLVRTGNNKELAEKINIILNNHDLRESMGRNGRKRVINRFMPERHIKPLIETFEKVIRNFAE